jgi:hypothetical protein
MDGCLLVFGSKHDAKHKLDRLVVCYDINHGLMYIKGKKEETLEIPKTFYCCFCNEKCISKNDLYGK